MIAAFASIAQALALARPVAAAKAVGRWLFADLWRLAAAVALLAFVWQSAQLNGLVIAPAIGPLRIPLIQIEGARPAAAQARAALVDRIRAEGAARIAQAAANHAPAAASRTIAEDTNAKTNPSRAAIRAAVAAYAGVNRLPCGLRESAAAGNAGGAADLPRTDHLAQGGDRSDLPPEMVAITRADLDGFAENTRALDQLRASLAALIASGWAIVTTATPEQPASKEGQ